MLDAVNREVLEETGLEVSSVTRVMFDEDYEKDKHGELTHYIFLIFKATAVHDRHKSGDDIVHLQWFTKEEMQNIILTRPGMKFLKEYWLKE